MRKFKTKVIALTVGLTAVTIISVVASQVSEGQVDPRVEHNFKVTSKKVSTSPFYKDKVVSLAYDRLYSSSPTNFAELLDAGDFAVKGTVIKLEGHVYSPYGDKGPANPLTIATIRVDEILDGDEVSEGENIRVMFAGGNISKKALLAGIADKEFLSEGEKEDAKSSEVITVKESFSPLPQMGESMALILNKAPEGANDIDGTYFLAAYSGKGVFLNNEGSYEREPEVPTNGGGENGQLRNSRSASTTISTEDEIMNKGMNELIASKS